MKKIKTKIVKQLLESGKLKPYDVVEHSYTDSGSRRKSEYTEIEKQLFTRGGDI